MKIFVNVYTLTRIVKLKFSTKYLVLMFCIYYNYNLIYFVFMLNTQNNKEGILYTMLHLNEATTIFLMVFVL